jgi:hypothetical protein
LIRRHRIFRQTPPWTSGLLLCVILTGQQANAADPGYPPPPGAYRSEPAAQKESTWPSAPAMRPGAADGGPESTQSSSRLLPLPEDMFGAKPGKYDANTLFGSPAPAEQGPSEVLERAKAQPPTPAGPDQFVPLPDPTETAHGFSAAPMDSGRGNQPPPAAQANREHGGSAHPGYPSHAPGYPAYRQPYQSPYYPGATTGYAPAVSQPGYADQYAPGYPQTGGMPPQSHYPPTARDAAGHVPESFYAPGYGYAQGDGLEGDTVPGTLPGAPSSAPLPAPGDSSVFRPPK